MVKKPKLVISASLSKTKHSQRCHRLEMVSTNSTYLADNPPILEIIGSFLFSFLCGIKGSQFLKLQCDTILEEPSTVTLPTPQISTANHKGNSQRSEVRILLSGFLRTEDR